MTKVEFIAKAAEKAGLSQKDMTKALKGFEDTMVEDIFSAEDKVSLSFGSFSGYTKVTKDRKGRNPKTGEELLIKGSTTKGYPKFKPSKKIKG